MGPLDENVISIPKIINPMASMPAEQFMRSVDTIPSARAVGAVGGAGAEMDLPFKIKDVSDTVAKAYVVYGTVTDIEPTDIATNITLTADATNTLYLECTLDTDGLITAAAVMVATTGLPTSTWDTAIKLIGTAITAGTAIMTINQSLYFSQGFQACGRDVADPETTPGTYQFFVD